jgi:hypothetical protein
MITAWPGRDAAYNCVMHTHQALSAYIIEKIQCPQDQKLVLLTEMRKMKNDLQLACIEGNADAFEAAVKKWAYFQLHRIFMNTLHKKFEQSIRMKQVHTQQSYRGLIPPTI